MKKDEIVIGKTYQVKVSGKIQPVRITGKKLNGGWTGINTNTGRDVNIRTGARLRAALG
jgi:hypothetical protein